MKQKRIGIFGGTFQPVHLGHLTLAQRALDTLALDEVLFVPDRIPPHKPMAEGATDEDRLQLLTLATREHPYFSIDTLEWEREGKSYTVDTLRILSERYPEAKLFFLMGSDMLLSFHTWYRPEEIASLATLVCTIRDGSDTEEKACVERLRRTMHAEVVLLPYVSPVSSTEIRDRVKKALPIGSLVPLSVELCIYSLGLYQPKNVRPLFDQVRSVLSEKRMLHTAGVIKTALDLAARYGADPEKARIAALLHDCAKEFPKEELLRRTTDSEPILPVLHAEVGAMLAHEQYGVTDPEILKAIRLHTTGDANMTKLDKILFLADAIEPGRNYPCVEELRKADSLDSAVLLALSRSLCYILNNGGRIHPATRRAIDDLGGNDGTVR